jgi:hypothetical protein
MKSYNIAVLYVSHCFQLSLKTSISICSSPVESFDGKGCGFIYSQSINCAISSTPNDVLVAQFECLLQESIGFYTLHRWRPKQHHLPTCIYIYIYAHQFIITFFTWIYKARALTPERGPKILFALKGAGSNFKRPVLEPNCWRECVYIYLRRHLQKPYAFFSIACRGGLR